MKLILHRLRRNPAGLTRLLLASLMVNLLGLASTLYMMNVLNRYIVYGVTGTLLTLTGGVTLAILGEYLFRSIRLELATEVAGDEDARLSVGLFGLLLTMPLETLRRRPPEEVEALVRGVDQEAQALGGGNIAALSDLPFVFLFVAILALLSGTLAWVTMGFMLALLWVGWRGQRVMVDPARRWRELAARFSALLATALRAPESVRHFHGKDLLLGRWNGVVQEAARTRMEMIRLGNTTVSLSQTIQAIGSVAVTAVGALLIVEGKLDVGTLIGANILASRALLPLGRLAALTEGFKKAETAYALAHAYAGTTRPEPESGGLPASCRGELLLRQVTMQWPERPMPLFSGLSLRVPAGEVLVVTGPNGSGKSTLLHLLAGLLQPSEGQILLDGIEMRQLSIGWRRRQIGFLPQEPTFLAATLKENLLAVAGGELGEERMRALLEAAGAARYVAEHPAGLEMAMSHDGREVPPGIRRRLALARALAVDGRVLLLDEPTVGLDREGVTFVYNLLVELARQGKTLVIATHDPTLVQGAGQVVDLGARSGTP
ncbi:MAG: ATP-binding cassette domain-containing protein [Magnetococcales bacterium]|nr:ATP-binding cassette domain-containing protein [Magnetococcales bacterium]